MVTAHSDREETRSCSTLELDALLEGMVLGPVLCLDSELLPNNSPFDTVCNCALETELVPRAPAEAS